tara:strand:+ start:202 stop:882 length:681 start_codon:yes stop_codon:yes gene_type:complete
MSVENFFRFDKFFDSNILAASSFKDISGTRIDLAELIGYSKDSIAIPYQTHSINVIYIDTPGQFENCDGLITNNSDILLSLQTADCIPIFFYDMISGVYGLVHAGWRGVINNIVDKSIKVMTQHKALPKDIKVLIGPSICKKCFEVGVEVARLFDKRCITKNKALKYFANLQYQVTLQLLYNNIMKSNIFFSNICSFENQRCCSFRRDKMHAGRMYSFMGIKNGLC